MQTNCYPIPNSFVCFCILLITCSPGIILAQEKYHDPVDDLGTIQFENYWDAAVDTDTLTQAKDFPTWWMYWTLPSLKLATTSVFAALEIDGMCRSGRYQDVEPDDLLMRYGLFGGVSLLNTAKHRGSLLVGSGFASDAKSLSKEALYVHLIYDHRVVLSDRLTLGIGLLFMNNFGEWRAPINLLPYASWRLSPRTRFRVAWDNAELRHLLTPRLGVSAEVRYDLSFFHLGDDDSVELETVGTGGGIDLWLFGDLYLRLRFKELIFRREIWRHEHGNDTDIRTHGGHSLKLQLVYAR